jgi:hypothetical protein
MTQPTYFGSRTPPPCSVPEVSHTADVLQAVLRALLDAPTGVVPRREVTRIIRDQYPADTKSSKITDRTADALEALESAGIARRAGDATNDLDNATVVLLSSAAADRAWYRLSQLADRNQYSRAFAAISGAGRWNDQRRMRDAR